MIIHGLILNARNEWITIVFLISRSKRFALSSFKLSLRPSFAVSLVDLRFVLQLTLACVIRLRWVASDWTNNSTHVAIMPNCHVVLNETAKCDPTLLPPIRCSSKLLFAISLIKECHISLLQIILNISYLLAQTFYFFIVFQIKTYIIMRRN